MADRRSLLAKPIKFVNNFTSLLEDLLFPVHCLGCRKEGEYLCARCAQLAPAIALQSCPFCAIPTMYGMTCAEDRKKHQLDGLTSYGNYSDWIWRRIVKAWKFEGVRGLDDFLIHRLRLVLPQLPHGLYNPVIVPVPLTKRRMRYRGFNQAEILAESIYRIIEGDLRGSVIRIKETVPQSKLGKSARSKNIHNAFTLTDISMVKDRDCIIVDDLLTTGATMNEIARILKMAGAKKVWGVSLLRAKLKTR